MLQKNKQLLKKRELKFLCLKMRLIRSQKLHLNQQINQMFLINVEHWKKVGSPTFDKAKNVELQDVNRSQENFHDDYTPTAIVKGESKKMYTNNTAEGSQVISALLENNYYIRKSFSFFYY